MIVRRLRLHPFGCFADRELCFAPGLTVVLGPNEAGKSTFFRGLRHALFVPATLTKAHAAKYVDPYLPASGGDTIRVEMEFEAAGGRWLLARAWGASPASELRNPSGAVLTADGAVQQKVSALLPARPGTFTGVLMAAQAEVAGTIASLEEKRETLSDLSDILRAAVLETGGVSVDRFRSLLGLRIDAVFSNWDRNRGCPKDSKGIAKPRKRQVGEILAAWYKKEELRAAAAAVRAWENELDELNARLREVSAAAAEQESFVSSHAKAAADARERGKLEANARGVRQEVETLTPLAAEWPGAIEKMRSLVEAIAALDGERAPLERERREAEREEEGRKLREKAERVARRKLLVQQAHEALSAVPRIERDALEEIRSAARELEKLQAGLEAGKLSVTVAGRKDVEIRVQEDFAPESARRLAPSAVIRLTAAGRLRIIHPDIEIEVRSGETDAPARVEKAQAAEGRLAASLAATGVGSAAEAETRWSAYQPLAADAAAAEKALADELVHEQLAAFEQRLAALGPARSLRPAAAIAADLARKDEQLKGRKLELDSLRRQVGDWEARHGSPEKLIGRLADARSEEKGYLERIARCAPLPDGFANADSFLRAWEGAREKATEVRGKEGGLREQRSALVAKPPDQSSEELAVALGEAEAEFQSASRRGQSLERINGIADELARGSDSTVTSIMRGDLEKTLAAMTAGRYTRVDMDGAVPRGLPGKDGEMLGRELLSAGTTDTLALALRLVMARHFLAGADGFLVMDDPLVDMDPDRQRAAAAALRQFAADRQLILFTCHPAAAEMLGGTLLEL